MAYFTDRNFGTPPRVTTEIEDSVREGLVGLLHSRARDGSFGLDYPEQCPDGRGPTGTDLVALRNALAAYRLFNFVDREAELPSTPELLDLIEFAYEKIAEPQHGSYHGFFDHYHLHFAQAEGRAAFRSEINRIFERNGIAFDLTENGQVDRIAPEGLRTVLTQAVFHTGDDILDELLERSRSRLLSRDLVVRKGLESLWDAWERLKSLEGGRDKRESTERIVRKASDEPNFRTLVDAEARLLTDIGNTFMIRHAEADKIPIVDDEHVDFLFHRMFAAIRLLLRKSNRGG